VINATRDRVALAAAVVVPLAVSGFLALFREHSQNTNAALVLVLVVVAVAANGNRVAGILAALSAGLWFDVLLTKPYGHLTITRRADVETTLLLLAVGIAVTEIALRGRQAYARADRDAAYLAGIQAAAQAASSSTSAGTVGSRISGELSQVLGLSQCRFERGVAGVGSPIRLRRDGGLEWHGKALAEGAMLPAGRDIELVIEQGGELRGRFLMTPTPGAAPSLEQRQIAVTLATQVASALR